MSSGLLANFVKFTRTTKTNKIHVIFVTIASAFFRFATLYLPYKWYSKLLGTNFTNQELCVIASHNQEFRAWKTGNFIERVCDKMPWKAKCLVRAHILKLYLDHYKIPYIINIGVAKGKEKMDKPFLAHAWVNVGKYTVSGGDGPESPKDFVIMNSFISDSYKDLI